MHHCNFANHGRRFGAPLLVDLAVALFAKVFREGTFRVVRELTVGAIDFGPAADQLFTKIFIDRAALAVLDLVIVGVVDDDAAFNACKVLVALGPLHKRFLARNHRCGLIAVLDKIGLFQPRVQVVVAAEVQEHHNFLIDDFIGVAADQIGFDKLRRKLDLLPVCFILDRLGRHCRRKSCILLAAHRGCVVASAGSCHRCATRGGVLGVLARYGKSHNIDLLLDQFIFKADFIQSCDQLPALLGGIADVQGALKYFGLLHGFRLRLRLCSAERGKVQTAVVVDDL